MTSAATTTSAITTSTARTQPSGDLASERAAWDAIRRSRNRADYDAFIAAFPAGQFAELARKRAAVPEGRVWDPVYYEPIEPGDRRRVESYFANRTRAAVSEVQRYNRKLNIYAPNRHEIKITSIQDFEVLDADPNGAIVKVIYMSGSLTWGTLDSHIYEAQWAANELRFTNHQKP